MSLGCTGIVSLRRFWIQAMVEREKYMVQIVWDYPNEGLEK
jgi:hypothetical protein